MKCLLDGGRMLSNCSEPGRCGGDADGKPPAAMTQGARGQRGQRGQPGPGRRPRHLRGLARTSPPAGPAAAHCGMTGPGTAPLVDRPFTQMDTAGGNRMTGGGR